MSQIVCPSCKVAINCVACIYVHTYALHYSEERYIFTLLPGTNYNTHIFITHVQFVSLGLFRGFPAFLGFVLKRPLNDFSFLSLCSLSFPVLFLLILLSVLLSPLVPIRSNSLMTKVLCMTVSKWFYYITKQPWATHTTLTFLLYLFHDLSCLKSWAPFSKDFCIFIASYSWPIYPIDMSLHMRTKFSGTFCGSLVASGGNLPSNRRRGSPPVHPVSSSLLFSGNNHC